MRIRTQCHPETPFEKEPMKSLPSACTPGIPSWTQLVECSWTSLFQGGSFFLLLLFLKRNFFFPLSLVFFCCLLKFLLSVASKNVTMVLGLELLIGKLSHVSYCRGRLEYMMLIYQREILFLRSSFHRGSKKYLVWGNIPLNYELLT